jgi:hypothetical protein
MADKLDEYIQETNRGLRTSRPKQKKHRKLKTTRETGFKRWAASAAMDLFRFYIPLLLLCLSGGLCLIIAPSIANYFFYASAIVIVFGVILCSYDFYHYSTWSTRLNYSLEGWSNLIYSRSPKFWDMNGEYWVPVKIVISMNEPVNEKHFRVLEAFLKKLRKRLNQWTVSKEEHFGYSQPNGWTQDGCVIAGDMNPRVLNLIRKRLAGELNRLSELMPDTIDKVVISPNGKEKYHQVYVESSD